MLKTVLKTAISVMLLWGAAAADSHKMQMGNMNKMGKMGNMFQSVSKEQAEILQKGKEKMYCPNCGMYLPKFYKTSHAVLLEDGSARQYCSIYCLVEEMEITELRDKKEQIKEIKVVDADSLEYIDAKNAHYVVGSSIKGTMSMTSKYAFKTKAHAEAFAKKNGGSVMDFDGAYEVALQDFAKDTAFVRSKRSTKMYKKGEKLYNKKCDGKKLEAMHAHNLGSLKAMIKSSDVCGSGLNDMQLQAISLYFWDEKMGKFEEQYGKNREIERYVKEFQGKMEKK